MAENKMEPLYFWIRYFKEHTNTIGCVELDGLDCREVLALLQELADKKADKPNKMEQVAAMFGKKLGEEFRAQNTHGDNRAVMFCEEGVMVRPGLHHTWFNNAFWLNDLLTGEAVIVND